MNYITNMLVDVQQIRQQPVWCYLPSSAVAANCLQSTTDNRDYAVHRQIYRLQI